MNVLTPEAAPGDLPELNPRRRAPRRRSGALIAARILGGVGRLLIGSGIIVLLFVAFQLWGTGIQESRAQSAGKDEFADLVADFSEILGEEGQDGGIDFSALTEQLAEAAEIQENANLEAGTAAGDADAVAETVIDTDPSTVEAPVTDDAEPAESAQGDETTPTSVAAETAAAPTQTTAAPVAAAPLAPEIYNILFPENGQPMAVIEIPSIGVEKVVYEGVQTEDLKKGPGHYPDNPLPGQPGNAAIAGHRTTYGAPFGDIDQLSAGDDIFVTTVLGRAHYVVQEVPFIVEPTQVEVLNDFGDNRITLTACHPKYSARQRLIATAQLVSEPFPVIARPEVNSPIAVAASTSSTAAPAPTAVPVTTAVAAAAQTTLVTETADVTDTDAAQTDAAQDGPTAEAGSPVDAGTETTDSGGALGQTNATDDAAARDDDAVAGDADAAAGDADPSASALATEANPADTNSAGTDPAGTDADVAADETASEAGLDAGLGWDMTALPPAIMWGLGFLVIGAIAWFIGFRRWLNKWAAYTLAFPVAGFLLWNCFFYVDKLLPAY